MKRWIVGPAAMTLLASLALFAGACSGGSHSGDDGSATPSSVRAAPTPSLDSYYQQKLHWKPCGHGFQCTKLRVPLDYTKPRGTSIRLAVTKLPATDAAHRIGSLVLNPGGPGASGIDYAQAATTVVAAKVRARFDIVGFDPRGVERSDPVRCASGSLMDKLLALDPTPSTPAELTHSEQVSQHFVRGCQQRSGSLLAHIGTVDSARDMDVLRAALGDRQLSYLGKSYGSYLGALYAQLFPGRVRALVLDGAVDPSASAFTFGIVQGAGFDTALKSFVRYCAGQPNCPLGKHVSVPKGVAKVKSFLRKAGRSPIRTKGDHRTVDEGIATLGVQSALYDRGSWSYLREALHRAMHGDGGGLLQLSDFLTGRKAGGGYSNEEEAFIAISCLDRPWPHKVSAYRKAAKRAGKKAPVFGPAGVWTSLPCAYWPVQADHTPGPIHAKGAAPILVVGTTRDPATPYSWAKALAKQLDSGVLLTRKGDGHTGYRMGNRCIDKAVDTYLISGNPPKKGTTCSA